jgi:hypothetical protein
MPIYTSYAYNTSNSTYNCSISVSDGRGGSSTKNVRITVRGTGVVPTSKPTVDAGTNKELNQGQSIVFNATASDSAGDELSYNWTCNNGTLSNSSILNPTYTAAYSSGSSTCTLTARNSKGVAASDSLIVTVRQDIVY